jgi:hypothetical protein
VASPDGKYLLFETEDGYINMLRSDGSRRHRVTAGFGAAWQPRR